MNMKLYGSLTSPYVRKVRVLLKEKNIACEFVVADAWAADSPIPAMNPLGKVPVLVREAAPGSSLTRGPRLDPIGDDGSVLFDSPLIAEYLDSLKGEPLIPASGEARWEVLRWHALAQGMLDVVVVRLLESRRGEKMTPEIIARQEGKIAAALKYADTQRKDGPYVCQNRLTLADISLAIALEYTDFRYAHDWRSRHPRLAEWLKAMSARPSFLETQPPKQ